ncbi:ATP-binding protein [Spirilliplanes yamanashiensis]|uniref:Guanylate cyclase domain-containing protein n=1 Tax=Spirilliplanes yamanashiensis TaxID=42233 RepID=A0A8J3Y3H5_9ACTN|nr:adenylate/guanylate cyclase domain-containing protein [Spirilliplanes yamanashiensis]MDP9814304.1 putative ATPase/class 3 adenylate cyclase [Spirilliplanes yamanashiensis]GIJ00713.1 hypothetical protein Sya03_00650 [Spirilliplanes yamanashiensis]
MSVRTQLPGGLVTFMFTDIEGSTRLARLLGAGYRPVLAEHRRLVRRVLSESDGRELSTEGDSFFAAFADAGAALGACLSAQRALAGHEWPGPEAAPLVRMGLHTGWAEPFGDEYTSAEVHRAARVASAAHGGQVLCSAATARYADVLPPSASLLDLGLHRLRGFDDHERLFQLVAPGLRQSFPRPRTERAPAHNLPAATTSFVGRQAERAELTGLLQRHRLVTVTGAGGAGKTRLAVEVAKGLLPAYPDGVWLVDAAGPQPVAEALVAAAGLRPEPGRAAIETLVEYAAARRLLVVVDTCEARPDEVAAVADRLPAAAPGVRVLVTGRESLGVSGEVVWRIPPLADAVRLLDERATAARGGRAPAAAERAGLARVAGRLEGLPLAVELAANRLRMLSADELAAGLDDGYAVLEDGRAARGPEEQRRHRSLAATVAWSYDRLAADEAELLRRLSVFAGPVDLGAVAAMTDGGGFAQLAALVDKSLVEAQPAPAGSRYRLLGPVRAFAARRLADAGDAARARDRHVSWVLAALRRVRADGAGRPVTLSLHDVTPLAAEGEAALRWCATGGSARLGLRLAGGLDPWWRDRGGAGGARRLLAALYARLSCGGERVPDAELARAFLVHAAQAAADGQPAEQARFVRYAERAARRAGDPAVLARALAARGPALVALGRPAEADRACREAIGWAGRRSLTGAVLPAVYCLADLLWRRGEVAEAAELLGAARPWETAGAEERGRRTVDMLLGWVALRRGDLVAAHDHLAVALRSRVRHGFRRPAVESLAAMAVRCATGGDPVTAATLFGAGRDVALDPWAARQQVLARARAGDAAFDAAYAAGTRLELDEAVALALAVEHPDLAAGSSRFEPAPAPAQPISRSARSTSAGSTAASEPNASTAV